MSVSNPLYVSFTLGVGHSGPYPFSLDYDDPSEIKAVAYHTSTGVVELTVASVDDLNDTVTFTDAVTSGSRLAIYRDTPSTQLEEFRKSGDFRAERYEDAVDKLYHVLQGLQSQSSNSMKLHETQDGFDPVLPYDMTQFPRAAPRVKRSKNGIDVVVDIQLIADASDAAAAALASADSAAIDVVSAGVNAGLAEDSASEVAAVRASVEAIAEPIDVTIIDLGTTGGNAVIGNTYLVDTSAGDVPVAVTEDIGSQGTLTIKNVSPDVNKVVISVPGSGADGYSTLTLVHPYQSITLTRNASSWYISGEQNDMAELSFPKLEYDGDSTVLVRAKHGRYPLISCAMADDRVYSYSGQALELNLETSGALGLDSGSVAADTWYYVYVVPSGIAWRQLTAIASAVGPDTGPAGYDIYAYVGAIRTLSAGEIAPFYQEGSRFFFQVPSHRPILLNGNNVGTGSPIVSDSTWYKIYNNFEATSGHADARAGILEANGLLDNALLPVTYSGYYLYSFGRSEDDNPYATTNYALARIMSSDRSSGGPSFANVTTSAFRVSGFPDHANQGYGGACNFKWLQRGLDDYAWFEFYNSAGDGMDFTAAIAGWEDGYLDS